MNAQIIQFPVKEKKDRRLDYLTDELIRRYGFDDLAEFHRMISHCDLSSDDKYTAFKNWQLNDGSKESLMKLPTQLT